MARIRAIIAALAVSFVAACGGGVTVGARVVTPAVMPVRAFPRIWVAAGPLEPDEALATALERHLRSSGRSSVRRVNIDALEAERTARRIPAATVVVLLESDLDESLRTEWTSRPETVCGPLGCYTTQRPYSYDVPTIAASVVITVYDGPSARVLQRVTVRSRVDGASYEDLRERVVENLARRTRELVDQRARDVDVELFGAGHPDVEHALAQIDAGRWHDGRRTLERFARTPAMRVLEPEDRARVLYDIAQARRFDDTFEATPVARLSRAERVLRAALELDPEEEQYLRVLAELGQQRRDEDLLREQREATEHNFRIGAPPPPGVPEPPASYRR